MKLYWLRILNSLAHDMIWNDSLLEGLVGCSSQFCTGVDGIQGKVHYWRKLAEISKEKAGTSSKYFLCMVREGLTKTSVHLTKSLPSYHGYLVDDDILDG